MKKLLSLALAVLLVMSLAVTALAEATTGTVTIENCEADAGDTITISVKANGFTDIKAGMLDYVGGDAFEFVPESDGWSIRGTTIASPLDGETLKGATFAATSGKSLNGEIYALDIKVKDTVATGTYTFKVKVKLTDSTYVAGGTAGVAFDGEVSCTIDVTGKELPVQPETKDNLPEGAIALANAGYKHANGDTSIYYTDVATTIGTITNKFIGTTKDANYYGVVIADKDGVVTYTNYLLGRDVVPSGVKTDVAVPAESTVIMINGIASSFDTFKTIEVGAAIKVYNVILENLPAQTENKALTDAGFTFENPEALPEVEVYIDGVKVEKDTAILTDADYVLGATSFSTTGLFGVEKSGYDYSAGAVNDNHTVTVLLKLPEMSNIIGYQLGAYKERNSFVDLPVSVKVYLSNDGSNYVAASTKGKWETEVEGLLDSTERSGAAPTGTAVYSTDWSSRCSLKAQYVKFVLDCADPWIFLSEVAVVVDGIGEFAHAIDEVPYSADLNVTAEEKVNIITSDAGEISLAAGATGDCSLLRAGVITVAKWDAAKEAYVVTFNEANPWPNDRAGSIKAANDEIIISTISSGNTSYAGSGDKWVMWFLEVGTELHVYDDVITIGKTLEGEEQICFVKEDKDFDLTDYTEIYDFASKAAEYSYNTAVGGETVRVFTPDYDLNNSNTKWCISVLLEKVEGYKAYKVVSVRIGDGSNYPTALEEDQLLLGVHSSSSKLTDLATYSNVIGKVVAMHLVEGDVIVLNETDCAAYRLSSAIATPVAPSLEGLENVAEGKSYTSTAATHRKDQYGDWSADDVQLQKLTDGVIAAEGNTSDIAAANCGYQETVIDLGEVKSIKGFHTDMFGGGWGIPSAVENAVEFYYSADGVTYTALAKGNGIVSASINFTAVPKTLAEAGWDGYDYYLMLDEAVDAQYVKVAYVAKAYVWPSEIEVYAEAAEPAEESSEEEPEESSEEPAEESSEEPKLPDTFDFGATATEIKVNGSLTGEDIVILTNDEAVAAGNTKWSVNVLLKKLGKDLYEVVSVSLGGGVGYTEALGEGEILLAIHSDSVGQNKDSAAAAKLLVAGNKIALEGLEAGTVTSVKKVSDDTTPETGDAGLVALAIVSVIALAGAVVVKKHN